jgi:hypothetical protein
LQEKHEYSFYKHKEQRESCDSQESRVSKHRLDKYIDKHCCRTSCSSEHGCVSRRNPFGEKKEKQRHTNQGKEYEIEGGCGPTRSDDRERKLETPRENYDKVQYWEETRE